MPPETQSINECVEVELLSTDPSAVAAVRATVEGLNGGYLLEQDGRFYVPAGYVAWACQKQGYVKGLVEDSASRPAGADVPKDPPDQSTGGE